MTKNWNKYVPKTEIELQGFISDLDHQKPKEVSVDTETTGLNIMKDTAFLFIIAFNSSVYTIEVNEVSMPYIIKSYETLANCETVWMHNAKYDLHILTNTGLEYKPDNVNDTMVLARLILDVDVPSFSLKYLGKHYIAADAKELADNIVVLKKKVKAIKTKSLLVSLKDQKLTLSKLEKAIKDPAIGFEGLEPDVQETYKNWATTVGHENMYAQYQPSYYDIYLEFPEDMIMYAANDAILTLELARKFMVLIINAELQTTLGIEQQLIKMLYRQERNGLSVDVAYLDQTILALKKEIQENLKALEHLGGIAITANQHKVIKDIYIQKWGTIMAATDKPGLTLLLKDLDIPTNYPAVLGQDRLDMMDFTTTILTLRSLIKAYGTYAMQYKASLTNGKIHSGFKQMGTKTGRMTSNVHQFPKEPVRDRNGEVMFVPRRLIIPSPNTTMFFLDFSQMELRELADYTIRYMGGDQNLVNAYMPFNVDPATWVPTDIHTLTAKGVFTEQYELAFKKHNGDPDLINDDKDFTKLRFASKTANFSIVYGAGPNGLYGLPKLKPLGLDVCKQLHASFKREFPGVGQFMKQVMSDVEVYGYVTNAFGRRYLAGQKSLSYQFSNYLIQGTCADRLKIVLIALDKYIAKNSLNIKILASVHDEVIFEVAPEAQKYIPAIKAIMEWQPSYAKVPMVSDVAYTAISWDKKTTIYKEGLLKLKEGEQVPWMHEKNLKKS